MRCLPLSALVCLLAACSSGGGDGDPPTPSSPEASAPIVWSANVAAASVPAVSIGGTAYFSSTRLNLAWSGSASGAASRYDVTWTETSGGPTRAASTTDTSLNLSDLKAGTGYRIEVTLCTAQTCLGTTPASVTVQTPAEVWQLQGTGGTTAGLTRIVSDGNVKIHALRYGADAPAGLAGRLRLYYGPLPQDTKGLAPATTPAAAGANDTRSYIQFVSAAGSGGLLTPASAAALVREVNTGQGVALSAAMGGTVRLFFEATGSDNKTRILFLDAQDGYAGLDFNSGAPSTCSTAADYASGGGCAPSVAIGVEGDPTGANAKLTNARQFKIGYPTLNDWRWDGAAGTFLVFTTDQVAGCSAVQPNHGYAVWSGTAWQVQYHASGCPKLFPSMQAAHPMHLGGARYKLYYGDPSDQTGRVAGSKLPFLGPKKLIYADGAFTGDAARVDFEDWESTAQGRPLVFLWPNGETLNAAAEGYIDDFSYLTPTGDLALQVMYLAITDGSAVPFAAAAVLQNP